MKFQSVSRAGGRHCSLPASTSTKMAFLQHMLHCITATKKYHNWIFTTCWIVSLPQNWPKWHFHNICSAVSVVAITLVKVTFLQHMLNSSVSSLQHQAKLYFYNLCCISRLIHKLKKLNVDIQCCIK